MVSINIVLQTALFALTVQSAAIPPSLNSSSLPTPGTPGTPLTFPKRNFNETLSKRGFNETLSKRSFNETSVEKRLFNETNGVKRDLGASLSDLPKPSQLAVSDFPSVSIPSIIPSSIPSSFPVKRGFNDTEGTGIYKRGEELESLSEPPALNGSTNGTNSTGPVSYGVPSSAPLPSNY